MRTPILSLVAAVAFSAHLPGQQVRPEGGSASQAVQNINKLETTISLDHTLYVPGEVIRVSVSIRNPTDQSIEVPNPFWPKGAGLDLMAKRPDGQYEDLSAEPHYQNPVGDREKVLLMPFEVVTGSLRSDEAVFSEGPELPRMSVPARPGEYRLIYSYDARAHADFTVGQPILERFISISLKTGERKNEQGKTEPVLQKINAIALGVGKQHLVLRTLLPTIKYPSVKTPIGAEWTSSDAMNFAPYERIAELPEPVTGLQLVPSANTGKILVRWSSASGRQGESEHTVEHSMQRAN